MKPGEIEKMDKATLGIDQSGTVLVLATLNNSAGLIGKSEFVGLCASLEKQLRALTQKKNVQIFVRDDAPETVDL